MTKSLWKQKLFTFSPIHLLNFNHSLILRNLQVLNKSSSNSKGVLQVVNRFIDIHSYFKLKNMNISIYNGKFFFLVKLKINSISFNFKYGELSYTRRVGFIHKAKKKPRLKKKLG